MDGKTSTLKDSADDGDGDAVGGLLRSSSAAATIVTSLGRQRQQKQHRLPLPLFNFSIPAESVAQVFFFRHYSMAGSNRLYAVQGSSEVPTVKMLGILAVGMAGLANSERDHGVMALARRKYGSTLHSINDAIKVRSEVTKESTVAAVTLMAMFEIIACQDRSSMEAWVCHVQGAAALLRHWTPDDWDRATNWRAYLHFFCLLAMSCIIRRTPVPTYVYELAQSSPAFGSDAEIFPAKRLFRIICKFANLYSHEDTAHVTQIAEKVSTAMSIEENLHSWKSELSETWNYTTIQDDTGQVSGGSRHDYACAWQAYIWNHYRSCRILLHAVLLQYLDALALPVTKAHPALIAAYTSQQRASRDIISTMLLDIRASVSYILGLYDKSKGNISLSPEHSGVFGLLGSIQALVGVVDVGDEDVGWLSEMLGFIGSSLGVGQALVLANRLREKS
ncbi:chondroitin ac alginate lyase [Trichoderma arundinaceum]|uniref:Chondroitin ac alginate lyase n=1 Tax=Trichoderma arundinaceum TaxID=490622 RepID=A0A395N8N4_TRIAR|nr:chondroitin ac alginate lyase [Trichoderma arundinaceum]